MLLHMEVAAAIIIAILLFYHYEIQAGRELKSRWFRFCLFVSLAAISSNIVSVWGVRFAAWIPVWVNMLLSSVYYLLACLNSYVILWYLFYMIFEHVEEKSKWKTIQRIMMGLMAAEVCLVVCNCFTGCLFSFQDNSYCRGVLNLTGHVVVIFEGILVVKCYFENRDTVSPSMKRMMYSMPYVIGVVVDFQLMYRDVLWNGMAAALANLIMFICFQSSRIGVDYLTGLGNRQAFMEKLALWMKKKKKIHVVFVALDQLESWECGQKNKDEFLYQAAQYLKNMYTHTNVYRLSDFEFALLCSKETCKRFGQCMEQMQKRFEQPWHVGSMQHQFEAFFADVLWEEQAWTPEQLVENLEYVLRQARKTGEKQAFHFDDTMNQMLERQKFVISQMHQAIEKKSYQVYYQPVYSWKNETFSCAEALVRLFDENGALISPAEFIPIAEEAGMVGEISWIVVEKVCAFLHAHREVPLDAVSINMSMQQFMDETMIDRLDAILCHYQIPYHMIKIEMTERVISENYRKVKEIMEKLMQRGIGFYLDDFGTGYSNFSSVFSLPFETIKLDKSLVDKVLTEGKEQKMVQSIIGMFAQNQYSLVAEGAEDRKTVERLQELQVDKIQGFYYAKPLPEAQFLEFLTEHTAS